ncbi:hypothetical protein H2200_001807 [Cladophialophora chaetospira]|uniref:Zn(2)-C6 fungal-type domain-containing protein n=1 Tax=Cladophialophora chaetospira TaxID=386627 RepID=A0AA39CQ13_9EURO|nr:hypothetical protein H2200_001807 [Cladophialophora chaetospira]
MPNYGRSGRCLTCKRRHVKCDEARPTCSPCRRLGLDCGGYFKDYAFRDENHRFPSAARWKTLKEQGAVVWGSAAAGEPSRSLLIGADVALPFFLVHYAGMGRSLVVARGFYEILIPVSTSQPCDSPLSLAVSAVALRIFLLWRHGDAVLVEAHFARYIQAVASVRAALERPEDRRSPATALAILALHLYESINAVYDARQAKPVHHHGALSLLPISALDSLDGLISTYVKGFVLHTEISSALRQKRPIHPNAYSYVNSMQTSSLVPGNISSTLDSIGASVAELQVDYVREMSQSSDPLLELQCRAWITEAGRVDGLLRAWARDVPDHWRPLRITSEQDFSPSITAYRSACDIYPSCQIATLWNLWRFHRLLLLKMTVGAIQRISTLPRDESTGDEQFVPTDMEGAIQAGSMQRLVDSICHSVPFYLGNRTKQSSLSDFTDPEILFPSYHSLTLGDSRIAAWHQDCGVAPLSKDEHHRHMVAYGAWHIMSPLSNLLTLFSDDHGGRCVARCLRPGQQEWISEQFLRVSTLIRLPAAGPLNGENGNSPSILSADRTAESLAKQVRKGAIFMSGP